MSTLKEDLTAIKEIQDGLVNNKVARFSYTHKAYTDNTVDGVNEYNVNNEQNIPNGTASIMKVNSTVLDKGYRAQASSITRMLMNHFLGRISYNLNKVNDNMQSLLNTLITKFPTSFPANGGTADSATIANKVANSLTFGSKTYNGSSAQEITAGDLGISTVSFSQFCPNLSKIKGVTLPFTIPEDGWILSIKADKDIQINIKIDGFTDTINVLPHQMYLGQFHDTKSNTDKKVVVPSMICPFPVRKGQVIASVDTQGAKVTITFTPCIGNQN